MTAIKIMSFGYSNGIPEFENQDAVCVVDVRQMKDPCGQVKDADDGLSPGVAEFLENDKLYPELMGEAIEAAKAGKMVAFGDGGGQYRSVAMAMLLHEKLGSLSNETEHRDLGKPLGYSGQSGDEEGEEAEGEDEYVDPVEVPRTAFMADKNKETATVYLQAVLYYSDDNIDLETAIDDMLTWLKES